MTNRSVTWTAYASTALFVLLWGSGAIFTKWGLDHAPAFTFLLLRFSLAGVGFALGALGCMTVGAIMQKRIRQSPAEVLPLQYVACLALCLPFAAVQPVAFEPTWEFLVPLLWLALVISVVAQLLLYRLIQAGNLVNVTSLFYLVPAATAMMDYLFLGNALPTLSLVGMAFILLGLTLVFRQPAEASRQ